MLGAAALALEGVDGGARVSAGRLVVCPTPIGNLEDVTLRTLAALREADVVACEDTRRTRMLLDRYGVTGRSSPTTSTTSGRGRASWCERMRDGAVVALVSDAGMPLVSRPGLRARAGVRGGGAGGRGAARPVARRWPRWSRRACRPTAGASPGSSRARRRELDGAVRRAGDAGRVRVAQAASPPSLRVLAASRPGAPGRGLPRADEGPRGGRARDGRRAGRRATSVARRRARSCSWSARRPGRRRTRTRRSRRCARWSRRARARGSRRGSSPISPARRANALYRALTSREGEPSTPQ